MTAGTTQGGPATTRVGWGFVTLYALSYTGGSLVFLAPLLVSLALKVNQLVGIEAVGGLLITLVLAGCAVLGVQVYQRSEEKKAGVI